jgi:hypothetical protein
VRSTPSRSRPVAKGEPAVQLSISPIHETCRARVATDVPTIQHGARRCVIRLHYFENLDCRLGICEAFRAFYSPLRRASIVEVLDPNTLIPETVNYDQSYRSPRHSITIGWCLQGVEGSRARPQTRIAVVVVSPTRRHSLGGTQITHGLKGAI